MTADQRLDQLEPLVSQTLAVADRHTAQLKQIFATVNHLQEAVGQLLEVGQIQSDNIQFVLREVSELRTEVGDLKYVVGAIEQNQSVTNTRIGDVENAISLMGIQVTSLDTKLDRILGLLDGNK